MGQVQSISVLLHFRDESRRFRVNVKELDISLLASYAIRLFLSINPNTKLLFSWKDEEGEEILLTTNIELMDAYQSMFRARARNDVYCLSLNVIIDRRNEQLPQLQHASGLCDECSDRLSENGIYNMVYKLGVFYKTIKLSYKGKKRRLRFNVMSLSYMKLVNNTMHLFPEETTSFNNLTYLWIDNMNNKIYMSSEEELKDALFVMRSQKCVLYKFEVMFRSRTESNGSYKHEEDNKNTAIDNTSIPREEKYSEEEKDKQKSSPDDDSSQSVDNTGEPDYIFPTPPLSPTPS